MTRVLTRIQAHPSRAEMHPALVASLAPLQVEVSLHASEPPNPWLGYRRALDFQRAGISHVLVIQDDAVVCQNFAGAVTRVAEANPETPVCLFLAYLPRPSASAGVASGYEYSLSYYDGYNHLPLIDPQIYPTFAPPPAVGLEQHFPRIREAGADFAWPLPWLTLKGEAAYFTSPDGDADEYVLYVIQAERQTGELSIVGGYAGEAVTVQRRNVGFAPDRGLTKSFLRPRVPYDDPNRSVAAEFALRQNLDGAWLKGEYSQAVGGHWRVTVFGNLIRGEFTDFIGQYSRYSHMSILARYSFRAGLDVQPGRA